MACRIRIDRLLVERGLFESRAKAQTAIAAGRVTADDVVVAKPSEEISADAILRAEPVHPYVSRGGVKLAAASASMSALRPGALPRSCWPAARDASMPWMSGAASCIQVCAGDRRSCPWKRP